jgi:PTS system mannose-specific IID component
MKPTPADFTAAFVRSFAIQGSWNLESMLGGGLVFALAPLLRRIHAGDPVALRESVERNAGAFNSHPYLSTVAVGAIARLEYDGEGADTLERFRTAIRGPLGALGDDVIWAGWRPMCAFAAILAYSLGLEARLAAAGFLISYNAVHVAIRWWGLRLGWSSGLRIGAVLLDSPLHRVSRGLRLANEVLLGAVLAMLVAGLPGAAGEMWVFALAAAVAAGAFLLPAVGGSLGILALFAATALWLVG